jgi:SAM-dependent methyltransferase
VVADLTMKNISYKKIFWKIKRDISSSFLLMFILRLDRKGGIPFSSRNRKGQTILRYYVDSFIESKTGEIHGDILEIGRSIYFSQINRKQINSYHCLDIEMFPDIDIIADIQSMPQIQNDTFDSIVCTQVLEHVKNPYNAINEFYRILRPSGKLLLTVPFLNSYHMEPHDYWRFTEYALRELLSDFSSTDIVNLGNTTSFILATLGISSADVDRNILLRKEKNIKFPVIIGAIAEK